MRQIERERERERDGINMVIVINQCHMPGSLCFEILNYTSMPSSMLSIKVRLRNIVFNQFPLRKPMILKSFPMHSYIDNGKFQVKLWQTPSYSFHIKSLKHHT